MCNCGNKTQYDAAVKNGKSAACNMTCPGTKNANQNCGGVTATQVVLTACVGTRNSGLCDAILKKK